MANQPYTYGIPDGTYTGRPTTASCYEKDGRLILDIRFAVKDPKTGTWYVKDNGYEWEPTKRHWLTSKDGGFNEATINGLREWAKGWNPQAFDDFYWFQREVDGVPFGNLAAVGEVELNFQTDSNGNQQIWVHDPNRPRGRKAYVPEGAQADSASLAAKWGAKAKALFAATPKKVGAATPQPAQKPAQAAPTRPAAAPAAAKPWAEFPQTADGAFAYFCKKLGEPYSSAKHDDKWFEVYDRASNGKDPDEFDAADVQRLFQAVEDAF